MNLQAQLEAIRKGNKMMPVNGRPPLTDGEMKVLEREIISLRNQVDFYHFWNMTKKQASLEEERRKEI